MTSHVPIHARNHRLGGVDPLDITLPRARVWTTYGGFDPYTVTPALSHTVLFDHGVTTDESTFYPLWQPTYDPPQVRMWILRGGVYAVTYRLKPDAKSTGGEWDDTALRVELYDPAFDYVDGYNNVVRLDGFPGVQSYVFTIPNEPDPTWAGGYQIHHMTLVVGVPYGGPEGGYPDITFGRADWKISQPTTNTDTYMEVVRLGDTITDDLVDHRTHTPADVHGSATLPTDFPPEIMGGA